MIALLLADETPVGVAPNLPLPDVFDAILTATGEPVSGEGDLCDPAAALPGDYVLGERGNWLRILEVTPTGDGWTVTAGRLPGIGWFVPAGHRMWVWPAADVMTWLVLGECAGGAR